MDETHFPELIRFRCSEELKAKLGVLAKRRHQKLSEFMRQLAVSLIEKEESERGPLLNSLDAQYRAIQRGLPAPKKKTAPGGGSKARGTPIVLPRAGNRKPI